MKVTFKGGKLDGQVLEVPEGTELFCDSSRIGTGRYRGMWEVWVYRIEGAGAVVHDHQLDGDVECATCGRCRALDCGGVCADCREVRNDEDPTIVNKELA